MSAAAFVWLQFVLPQRLLGACVRALATTRRRWLSQRLIRWFANLYAVDLGEAARPRIEDYASFNDFFTRELRDGARPLAGGQSTIASPADGCITEFGTAVDGTALQAKGMTYRLDELLGERPASAHGASLGSFATIYLAPSNYHRVHLPLAGTLAGLRYVPGKRFSVNAVTAARIPRLFCRNERLIAWFETAAGPMAVVLIGALNVAGIECRWLGKIDERRERDWSGSDFTDTVIDRGGEIGRFNLGSTVVVVLPAGAVDWGADIVSGQSIRMGERLGDVVASD
jgi:phosphatidylserine decarboxylase